MIKAYKKPTTNKIGEETAIRTAIQTNTILPLLPITPVQITDTRRAVGLKAIEAVLLLQATQPGLTNAMARKISIKCPLPPIKHTTGAYIKVCAVT